MPIAASTYKEGVDPFTLREAQALVEDAKKRMSSLHERWANMRRVYRTGRWGPDDNASFDADGRLLDELPDVVPETINYTLAHLNVIVSSVIDRDPQHTAVPISGGPESEQARHAVEALLRFHWRMAQATAELRNATKDMCIVGNGFLKVGGEMLEYRSMMPVEEIDAALRSAAEAEWQASILEGREPSADMIVNSVDPVRVTEEWRPWVQHVRPEDIFVGVDCTNIRTASWVAQRVVVLADEVRTNPEYKKALDSGVEVQTSTFRSARAEDRNELQSHQGGSDNGDRPFEYATLYEFYDMRARRLMVFQLGAEKPLYDDDIPWQHPYTPYEHLGNYQDGDEFWCFGEIENIASIQEMMNELVEEQCLNARRAGTKYLVDDKAVDSDLQAALESDEHEVVAKVRVPNGANIRDIVIPVDRKGMPEDVYRTDAMLRQAMQDVLGINDFQAGGMGADRMSATAASLVEGIATIRAADKIRAVEVASAWCGQLMLMLAQEFLADDTAVRIVGRDDAEGWLSVSRSDINHQYLVSVQPESTKALNPQARQQKALQGIQEIVPALAQLGYDPEPALRSLLRDAGYDPDVLLARKVPPQPAPGEVAGQGGLPSVPDEMGALGSTEAFASSSAGFPEAELEGAPLA